MPDNLDQVESKQHIRFMLDFACDKNNTEQDEKQEKMRFGKIENAQQDSANDKFFDFKIERHRALNDRIEVEVTIEIVKEKGQ